MPAPRNTQWTLQPDDGPVWVWPEPLVEEVNQYLDVAHDFELETLPEDAELRISVDSDYALWLNGTFVGRGQFSDYPDQKTFTRWPVASYLRTGRNRLAMTAYHDGTPSSTYCKGAPGVLYELTGMKTTVQSGSETRLRRNPCYFSGPMPRVSGQLSYTFGYNAVKEDQFQTEPLGDGWAPAGESDQSLPEDRRTLIERPLPVLQENGLTSATLQAQGLFRRDIQQAGAAHDAQAVGGPVLPQGLLLTDGKLASVGWMMQHDALLHRHPREIFIQPPGLKPMHEPWTIQPEVLTQETGVYLIIDMGQQEVGLLELDIEAPEGCVLDLGYGEHIDDLRVRTWVGGRSFSGRYICRKGRQQFTHHVLRWAGRYLQVQIHGIRDAFTLHKLGLRRTEFPVHHAGTFLSPDSLHEQIIATCKRTLHLCMHEHYEDTPWREQALYANDARIQALCGYYAFGENRFPAVSFDLLGKGTREDGYIRLTAPAEPPITIPSFTFAWMLAVRDHLLHTGDPALAGVWLPRIVAMLQRFLDQRKEGLLPLNPAPGLWHFYDWTQGLSGRKLDPESAEPTFDSLLNCCLILSLEAALQMKEWLRADIDLGHFPKAMEDLRSNVHARFFDSERNRYLAYDDEPVASELPQALALLAGVVPQEHSDAVEDLLCNPEAELSPTSLSQSLLKYDALLSGTGFHASRILNEIRENWGGMLAQGATTFWETLKGASDFGYAGSMCHGWSTAPLYVYYRQVLGIRPTEPGFTRFAIEPIAGGIPCCEGTVPTPHGPIQLQWELKDGVRHYTLSAPAECTPEMLDPTGVLERE